jgi:hypothetical protein
VTITVLAVLLAGAAAAAATARTRLPAALTAGAAVATAAGLASAVALASGWPARYAGLALLGVAALAQAVPVLLAARRPVTGLAAELSGWAVAAAGTALTLGRPGTASAGLTVAGLLCLGAAARRDRRPLFWAGLALLSGALWAWLAAAGVHAPEPYAAPAAAVALGSPPVAARRAGRVLGDVRARARLAAGAQPGGGVQIRAGPAAAARPACAALAGRRAGAAPGAAADRRDVAVLTPTVNLPGHRAARRVLPGWVPFAVTGAILLTTGATMKRECATSAGCAPPSRG